MKEIKLSKTGKRHNLFTKVDDEYYEWLNQWNWCVSTDKLTQYAIRNSDPDKNGKRHLIWMHREIMNTPKHLKCDHAFHDGLDNRKFIEVDGELKQNLRNCTQSQNCANRRSHVNKYKGVYMNHNRYYAQIKVNGTSIILGYFDTEEKAARRYDIGAIKYFGEFATLNFKEELQMSINN